MTPTPGLAGKGAGPVPEEEEPLGTTAAFGEGLGPPAPLSYWGAGQRAVGACGAPGTSLPPATLRSGLGGVQGRAGQGRAQGWAQVGPHPRDVTFEKEETLGAGAGVRSPFSEGC